MKWLACFFWKCKFVDRNEETFKSRYQGIPCTVTMAKRVCKRCGKVDAVNTISTRWEIKI
jgi:hypothetical protein